jgi:hypothetical protein
MPIRNRVVVRCLDGSLIKGYTLDFSPTKDVIHVIDPDDENKVTKIGIDKTKAVFYVKSFEGARAPHAEFTVQSLKDVPGMKLRVTFRDGEVMFGTTNGYSAGRKGFFVIPADKTSNNERVYVFSAATTDVKAWR